MAGAAQAPYRGSRRRRRADWGSVAAILCALTLTGCGVGSLTGADMGVDRSMVTSNVPSPTAPADPDRRSDEMTIRNAVSAADPSIVGSAPLAWANADTGSRGSISTMVETKESGTVCREFTTTRESFDGVALFNGKACRVAPGAWQLTAFAPS